MLDGCLMAFIELICSLDFVCGFHLAIPIPCLYSVLDWMGWYLADYFDQLHFKMVNILPNVLIAVR